MDTPFQLPDPTNIARRAGPLIFGQLANWMLYGILCVQTYVYSYNFPDDKRSLKFLVYFVFSLETVQVVLTGADVYYWFVAGFGEIDRLWDSHFYAIDGMAMNVPISLIVQGFYCYRIWTLNKRWRWICVVIAILSLLQATATAWSAFMAGFTQEIAVLGPVVYVWFIASALADILIAVTMTLLLRQMRRCEGLYSKYILPRVVRLTIETNALTTATAIISFVLVFAFPGDIYFTFPTTIIDKLYSNTLLLTLNNRIYFRDHPPPATSEDSARLGSTRHQPTNPSHFVENTPSELATITFTSTRLNSALPTLPKLEDAEKGKDDVIIIGPDRIQLSKAPK